MRMNIAFVGIVGKTFLNQTSMIDRRQSNSAFASRLIGSGGPGVVEDDDDESDEQSD